MFHLRWGVPLLSVLIIIKCDLWSACCEGYLKGDGEMEAESGSSPPPCAGKWSNEDSKPGPCAITCTPALLGAPSGSSPAPAAATWPRLWQCKTKWGHLAGRGTGHQLCSGWEVGGIRGACRGKRNVSVQTVDVFCSFSWNVSLLVFIVKSSVSVPAHTASPRKPSRTASWMSGTPPSPSYLSQIESGLNLTQARTVHFLPQGTCPPS